MGEDAIQRAYLDNCQCAALGSRAPCGWCEDGGPYCRECEGEGEYPHPAGLADHGIVSCDDCGGTGTAPEHHSADCTCCACLSAEIDAHTPEPSPGAELYEIQVRASTDGPGEPLFDHHRGTIDGIPRKELVERGLLGPMIGSTRNAPHPRDPRVNIGIDTGRDDRTVVCAVSKTADGTMTVHASRPLQDETDLQAFLDEAYRAFRENREPTATVPRIEGNRRADYQVPATVHENVHNLGCESGNEDAHRMGFRQDLDGDG